MFSTTRLTLRSLCHYWRTNLAVLAATAVGVAVLTGALLVGHSVRASLRALVLERLGRIDHVLVSDLFFRESLSVAFPGAAPAILLTGSATNVGTGAMAAHVQVLGVSDAFWALGDMAAPGLGDFDAALNAEAARELQVGEGDEIVLRVQKPSAAARETFLGERDDTVAVLRLRVKRVIPTSGVGGFTLRPSQRDPLNVFVPLAALQRRTDREGRVNAILAPGGGEATPEAILRRAARLEDAGLHLRKKGDALFLESDRIFLSREDESLARAAFGDDRQENLAYLANAIRIGDRVVPYSMVAATAPADIAADTVLLNQWTADQLHAKPGDSITLTYFVENPRSAHAETSATLTVGGVLAMDHPLVDRALAPDFPGIADAENMADWDPPFPLDLARIRPEDEDYWETYRATPKVLLSLETGQRLWGNRYGRLTSISARGADAASAGARMAEAFDPAEAGLVFRPIKQEGLAAGKGASDFGGLFIGFSLFLLVSAVLLIQILFRLGVEGRVRQIGLLAAVGYSPRRIRNILLGEGALVAGVGAVLGAGFGVAYCGLMILGLHTWWLGAIGAPFLRLSVDAVSLVGGALGGWVLAVLSIWQAVRAVLGQSPRALLAGRGPEQTQQPRKRRRGRWVGAACCVVAVLLVLVARFQSSQTQAILFFGVGALLLAGALSFFFAWLGGGGVVRPERFSLMRLGLAASRRRPVRSLLVAGLMALATFLIVAVGANRHAPHAPQGKGSGTGGFSLLAESALPLYREIDGSLLDGGRAYGMRLRPGDDAGCLNLYQAARPRVLGAPADFVERGGFAFAGVLSDDPEDKRNPWRLLERPLADGAIPTIGDYNTVMWLLHLGLGKDLEMDGRRFRFVALLKGSVFQSELLVSERNFEALYPFVGGRRFFAIETPGDVAARLETEFARFGFDATGAAEKLHALKSVENTYLSTFQSLGGLGLLLGTLGLALAMLRSLIERRGEFALLRALGYRRSHLTRLVLAENGLLLVVGLAIGAAAALVAVAPSLAARAVRPPWLTLSGTLLAVLVFGLIATVCAARLALRAPALQTLREER